MNDKDGDKVKIGDTIKFCQGQRLGIGRLTKVLHINSHGMTDVAVIGDGWLFEPNEIELAWKIN